MVSPVLVSNSLIPFNFDVDSKKQFLEIIHTYNKVGCGFPEEFEKYSPLHIACALGRKQEVKQLIGKYALSDETAYSPYSFAAIRLHFEIVEEYYVQATLQEQVKGLTMCALGDFGAAYELLWQRASLDCKRLAFNIDGSEHLFPRYEGSTVDEQVKTLQTSIVMDRLDRFKIFWEKSKEETKKFQDKDFRSWLFLVIQKNKPEFISYLLDQGVETCIWNADGNTPGETICLLEDLKPEILEKFLEKDNGFTNDKYLLKLIGNRFDLDGIHFEGFVKEFKGKLCNTFILSLEFLLKIHPNRSYTPSLAKVKKFLEDSLENDPKKLASLSLATPILVRSGWNGHAICCIFSPEICVKINTGTGPFLGIRIYKMEQKSVEIREKMIAKLIHHDAKRVSEEEGIRTLEEEFDKELLLTLIGEIDFEQSVGNCSSKCLKAAMFAYLILAKLNFDPKEILPEILTDNKLTESFTFSFWEEFDRNLFLKELFNLHKKYPTFFDLKETLSKIILNAFNDRTSGVVLEIILLDRSFLEWKCPKTSKSLLRLAFEKMNTVTFFHLLQLGYPLKTSDIPSPEEDPRTIIGKREIYNNSILQRMEKFEISDEIKQTLKTLLATPS